MKLLALQGPNFGTLPLLSVPSSELCNVSARDRSCFLILASHQIIDIYETKSLQQVADDSSTNTQAELSPSQHLLPGEDASVAAERFETRSSQAAPPSCAVTFEHTDGWTLPSVYDKPNTAPSLTAVYWLT